MLPVTNIALAGLSAAESRLTARAQNIANAATPGYQAAQVHQTSTPVGPVARIEGGFQNSGYPTNNDRLGFVPVQNKVNLAAEIVDFKLAEASYKANLKVLQAADDLQKSTLEILT